MKVNCCGASTGLNKNNSNKISSNYTSKTNIRSSDLNVRQQQVSFKGLGSLFHNLVVNKKIIKPEFPEEVISRLCKEEFGCYALTKKGFIPVTPAEFKKIDSNTASELYIKNPPSVSELTTGDLKGNFETTTYNCRRGISPYSLISYIEHGFNKITTLVDDGMHVLTINKMTDIEKGKLIKNMEKTGVLDEQSYNTIYMMPEYVPEYWFELTQKMIEKSRAKGISLEKVQIPTIN